MSDRYYNGIGNYLLKGKNKKQNREAIRPKKKEKVETKSISESKEGTIKVKGPP